MLYQLQLCHFHFNFTFHCQNSPLLLNTRSPSGPSRSTALLQLKASVLRDRIYIKIRERERIERGCYQLRCDSVTDKPTGRRSGRKATRFIAFVCCDGCDTKLQKFPRNRRRTSCKRRVLWTSTDILTAFMGNLMSFHRHLATVCSYK